MILHISLLLLWSLVAQTTALAQDRPLMTYQMVFMRPGPNTSAPADPAAMQQGHLALLLRLNAARTNLLFGPFVNPTDLVGIAVVDAPTAEAARAMFADDPYVKAGHVALDVRTWLSPTGAFHPLVLPPTPEPFVFGFLKSGPVRGPSEEAQAIQAGHLAYMNRLHVEGRLVAAGPFSDGGDYRGIVIYRVATLDEARALAAGDPAVKAGRLIIDARLWMTFKGILK